MFLITGVQHIQIAMPSDQENIAQEFYSGILGLEKLNKPLYLQKRGGCWFSAGGFEVHLGVDPNFVPAKKAHPGFLVTNLEAAESRLLSLGINIIWDKELSGYKHFYVNDPFGNRLELMERISQSDLD